MLRYFLQISKGYVPSMTRLRADKVVISGNFFLKRSYLDFIADSFQLMTKEVRNIGVNESDELASSADFAVIFLQRAQIAMSLSSCFTVDVSISLMRDKTFCFLSFGITDDLHFVAAYRPAKPPNLTAVHRLRLQWSLRPIPAPPLLYPHRWPWLDSHLPTPDSI